MAILTDHKKNSKDSYTILRGIGLELARLLSWTPEIVLEQRKPPDGPWRLRIVQTDVPEKEQLTVYANPDESCSSYKYSIYEAGPSGPNNRHECNSTVGIASILTSCNKEIRFNEEKIFVLTYEGDYHKLQRTDTSKDRNKHYCWVCLNKSWGLLEGKQFYSGQDAIDEMKDKHNIIVLENAASFIQWMYVNRLSCI